MKVKTNGTITEFCASCGEAIEGEAVITPIRLPDTGERSQLGLEFYHPTCAAQFIYELRYPPRAYDAVLLEAKARAYGALTDADKALLQDARHREYLRKEQGDADDI